MQHVPPDPDHALRTSAIARARELALMFNDIVPLGQLRSGFIHEGRRISFGSFQKGIHRAREQQGQGALTVTTAPPKPGRAAPYDDVVDMDTGAILYHYRSGSPEQSDNRALRAALELQAPLIYFWGIAPGQYQVVSPVFVTEDDPSSAMVMLEVGLPFADTRGEGLVSATDTRRYALSVVMRRYHQARFRRDVMHAYGGRCAVCALRESQLIDAAHIIRDPHPEGVPIVVNGIALCAIHHLAYDRNLLGINPRGVVHISDKLLRELDGPMLREGLQGFHEALISQPARQSDRPDPARLATRFEEFERAA
jgi:putative restriction endonuclease